jgi:hypothetical protein
VRAVLVLLLFALAATLAAPGSARVPRDPSWEHDWAQTRVRMPEVWDHTTGSAGVVIASVDTGVNADLPDLAGAIGPGWDFVDGDAVAEDTMGHGSLVASEMVARGDNFQDIAGYCWQCTLMPIRVSSTEETDDSMIARGIRWAVDSGARIVNVGLVQQSGPAPDGTIGAAVAYANARNVLVVTSAGNTGDTTRTWPGAYPGVLAVAGTDEQDQLHSWSTRGSWVQLAAPGCQAVIARTGPWGWLCGTSFSAPVVSAVAALALSLKPSLSAAEIRRAFIETSVPVSGIAGGRLDAFAALRQLGAIQPAATPPPAPPASPPVASPPPPPPPASAPGKTTSTARPASTKVTRAGRLRRGLRVPVSLGTGRLTVKLTLTSARQCELSIASGANVLLATRRQARLLGFARRVGAGRYVVEVSCRTKSPKRYRLSIVGTRAPRTVAPSAGG